MCRLVVYMTTGSPGLLSDLVLTPTRSLSRQSYDARERASKNEVLGTIGSLNGDGFGMGWYTNFGSAEAADASAAAAVRAP